MSVTAKFLLVRPALERLRKRKQTTKTLPLSLRQFQPNIVTRKPEGQGQGQVQGHQIASEGQQEKVEGQNDQNVQQAVVADKKTDKNTTQVRTEPDVRKSPVIQDADIEGITFEQVPDLTEQDDLMGSDQEGGEQKAEQPSAFPQRHNADDEDGNVLSTPLDIQMLQ